MLRLSTLLIATLSALAACGGGGSSPSPASPTPAVQAPPPVQPLPTITDAAATRFLEAATFGPTNADIAHLKEIGYDAWFDEQFALPQTDYPAINDTDSLDTVQAAFFRNALTARDQLRQRLAFAMGQIFVVSSQKTDSRTGIIAYQKMLLTDALGNYRTLLKDVTLSPAMGNYLDMANNAKADVAAGTSPNENYAREVLQLFSIGVARLNADGTAILDANRKPVPAYSQDNIEGFARAFTGWTYPTKPSAIPQPFNNDYFVGIMELREDTHEPGTKLLLNGTLLPAAQGAARDLDAAIDNIVADPNVGPFIGTRLIQALVKSNPSPAYVQRVAGTFANNGKGARGDLKATVRAVLMDPEARLGDTLAATGTDGKLREPVLFMTRLLRAFGTVSDGRNLPGYAQQMRQDVFNAPSVFNFYPPSYKPKGLAIVGPEFKIANSPTLSGRLNFLYDFTSQNLPAGTVPDFAEMIAAAADNARLIPYLDARLMHGTLPAAVSAAVVKALPAAGSDNRQRAMLALYLVAASPAFNVQR